MNQQPRSPGVEYGSQLLKLPVGPFAHEFPLAPHDPLGGAQILEVVAPEGHLPRTHGPFILNGVNPRVAPTLIMNT